MTGYTITITPDDAHTGALTTIRVDTETGDPKITELTVRPADGTGLSPYHQLPAIDLVQLVGALRPSRSGILEAAPGPVSEEPAEAATGTTPPVPAPASRAAGRRPARKTATRKAAKAPARRAAAKAARAAGGEGGRRGAGSRRRSAEPSPGSGAAQGTGGRAYRRMPDASEVVSAYRQAGTTSALAEHYGVPRHTAVGWVRRLRREGLLEPSRRGR